MDWFSSNSTVDNIFMSDQCMMQRNRLKQPHTGLWLTCAKAQNLISYEQEKPLTINKILTGCSVCTTAIRSLKPLHFSRFVKEQSYKCYLYNCPFYSKTKRTCLQIRDHGDSGGRCLSDSLRCGRSRTQSLNTENTFDETSE